MAAVVRAFGSGSPEATANGRRLSACSRGGAQNNVGEPARLCFAGTVEAHDAAAMQLSALTREAVRRQ